MVGGEFGAAKQESNMNDMEIGQEMKQRPIDLTVFAYLSHYITI